MFGSAYPSFSSSLSLVALNPQPLPPVNRVALNPQPLPPRWLAFGLR
jgi:hypothetical protein